MSNSSMNLFRRQGPQRVDLCECTFAQLNRQKSTEVCFDSFFKPPDRKKLSISGTLQKKKQLSLKKNQCKNKFQSVKPQPQEATKQPKQQHDNMHQETQQNQSLAVNATNIPTSASSVLGSKPAKPHQTIPLYRVSRQEVIRRQQTVVSPPSNVVYINLERASPAYKHVTNHTTSTPVNATSPYKSANTFKASQISKQLTSAETAALNGSTDRSEQRLKGSDQKTNSIVPREVESIYGDSYIQEMLLEESMESDTSRELKQSVVLSRLAPDFSKIRIAKSHYSQDRRYEDREK